MFPKPQIGRISGPVPTGWEARPALKSSFQQHGASSLAIKTQTAKAIDVAATKDTLSVELADGRTISVPLNWYPRLVHASSKERSRWRLIGNGRGIHWPGVDEDISVENLLAGKRSGESAESFMRWCSKRGRH